MKSFLLVLLLSSVCQARPTFYVDVHGPNKKVMSIVVWVDERKYEFNVTEDSYTNSIEKVMETISNTVTRMERERGYTK